MSKIHKLLFLLVTLMLLLSACSGNRATPESSDQQKTIFRQKDGMQMIFVPGTTFRLSEGGKLGKGAHQVTLDSYWIDQTEITNSHYRQCVDVGVCDPPTSCSWGEPTYSDPAYDDHPVICVTWQMANSYCQWAGGRLPSEAEWEYAARGPERFKYAWGDNFDPVKCNFCDVNCPNSDSRDQTADDGYSLTAPVGSFPDGASWCGAVDMNGNVWEWVFDWYAPYTSGALENPTGPARGDERVIRGGSWYDTADFLRAEHRHPYDPNDHNHLIGFRCAAPDSEITAE
jgi:formylglycine-generating enzyme required for sulfatase activity